MKGRTPMWALAALLACGSMLVVSAQQRSQSQIDLQAAIRTESVDGNLGEAIKQYAAVVTKHRADRTVVASALVHMAECYQKLGDAESRRIYERLVREFGDQPEAAAIARARLGRSDSPVLATRGDRAVWSGLDVDLFGTISPDGRFLSYTDWFTTNNTMLRDLVSGKSRALTANATKFGELGYSGWSAIARDGRQIAFEWKPTTGSQLDEIRMSSLAGTGVPDSRLLVQLGQGEAGRPFDWSPDGRSIAMMIERADGASTIGVLSTADGTLRRFKSVDWRGVNKMVFSPDGRWFAYDIATTDDGRQAEIVVMSSDGTQERKVVSDGAENHLMGWAADGHLVFASRRSGMLSLWVVPVADGRTTGTPRLVKDNISSHWSLGLTSSGSLYVWKRTSSPYVKTSRVDFSTGRLLEDDGDSFQRFIDSRGRPSWSRDGSGMLFISCGASGGGPCALYIRDSSSGAVREIPHSLRYMQFPQLSPDGRFVVTDGRDLKGRGQMFLIDTTTGTTTRMVPDDDRNARNAEWSPDGRMIRYQEFRGSDRVVVQRAPDSDATTDLLRVPRSLTDRLRISPDDRLFGYVQNDPAAKTFRFVVQSMTGGEPRVLVTGALNTIAYHWVWLPDSTGILLARTQPGGNPESLWLVPLSGEPRKLDVDVRQWQEGGVFSVHPDGRHLAYVAFAGEPGAEVWALENFLPRQAGGASR